MPDRSARRPARRRARRVPVAEIEALARAAAYLDVFGPLLVGLARCLEGLADELPLPDEPELTAAFEDDEGPDRRYPTAALHGDLQCFARDLRQLAAEVAGEEARLERRSRRRRGGAGARGAFPVAARAALLREVDGVLSHDPQADPAPAALRQARDAVAAAVRTLEATAAELAAAGR